MSVFPSQAGRVPSLLAKPSSAPIHVTHDSQKSSPEHPKNPSQFLVSTSSALTPCPAKHDIFSSTILLLFLNLSPYKSTFPAPESLPVLLPFHLAVLSCQMPDKWSTLARATLPVRKETLPLSPSIIPLFFFCCSPTRVTHLTGTHSKPPAVNPPG